MASYVSVPRDLTKEARVIRPRVRPYKTDNYYEALIRVSQTRKKIAKIVGRRKKA